MANTLKLGNGKWATGKDTLMSFSDTNNNFKPLPFDFSRASSATVVNQSGLIETVQSGTPRIDFLGNTKGALLLEPQRSNVIQYSESFINSYWVKATVSLSSNQIISPNGALDADKITESSTNGLQQIYSDVITTTPSSDYVYSIFIKKAERSWVKVMTANNSGANFNVENGIIGMVDSGVNAEIEDYGNGWFKCSVSFNTSVSADRVYVRISTSNGVTSYQGDGTSGVYIYGAQLEAGSYATSYIPTSGQSGGVTRVAETCSQTVPDGVIGQTEGTIYADIEKISGNEFASWRFSISDSTSNNWLFFSLEDTFDLRVYVRKNSSTNVDDQISNKFVPDGIYKVALAYANNNLAVYINGSLAYSSTSANIPNTAEFIITGNSFSTTTSAQLKSGKINQTKLYNTRLSNAELQALTTI